VCSAQRDILTTIAVDHKPLRRSALTAEADVKGTRLTGSNVCFPEEKFTLDDHRILSPPPV